MNYIEDLENENHTLRLMLARAAVILRDAPVGLVHDGTRSVNWCNKRDSFLKAQIVVSAEQEFYGKAI